MSRDANKSAVYQTCTATHHSSATIVVQIHECPGVLHHPLSGVNKGLGKFDAIVDVVTASAPVEVAPLVAGLAALVPVTIADLDVALTARPGDGVDHSGRRDGVHKCCFSAALVRRGTSGTKCSIFTGEYLLYIQYSNCNLTCFPKWNGLNSCGRVKIRLLFDWLKPGVGKPKC